MNPWVYEAVRFASALFFGLLLLVIARNPVMFLKRFGRSHAQNGLIYLSVLAIGFYDAFVKSLDYKLLLLYNVLLGTFGSLLPLTAASEFKHKRVKNIASGTLDVHATVTYNEMIEHCFYQLLNLAQILFLHGLSVQLIDKLYQRLLLLLLTTLPWHYRQMFPINRFSDNYTKIDERSTSLIRTLYRVKKYQYMFYKHFLLHGLNVSVVFSTITSNDNVSIATDQAFRIYWLLLNTAYSMEFFLQTLVKKNYLSQQNMLLLQLILMSASSLAAVYVLVEVNLIVALLSLLLNLVRRKHDVSNTLLIAAGYLALACLRSGFDVVLL